MFTVDDAFERASVSALIDFASWASKNGLIDKDKKPERFLFLLPSELDEILAWPSHVGEAMIAEMTDFILGEPVTWGDPEDGNCMKPLHEKAGWLEFKNRTSPHSRLFAAFAGYDVLIGIRSRLKKDVPKDNEEQIGIIWEELWGSTDVPRLDCRDPGKVVSNVDAVAK